MNEQALISALQKGDAAAYGQLVIRYQHMVYSTALGLLQQEADAEDITQEVFVAIYQNIKSFKGEARLSTWIYRITVTKTMDALRKKGRKKRSGYTQPLEDDGGEMQLPTQSTFHHPGVLLENKERAAILFSAIEQLPEQQKTAFILSQTEQLSYAEIATAMDTTVSSVDSLLFRAKKNLRGLLGHYYDTHEK